MLKQLLNDQVIDYQIPAEGTVVLCGVPGAFTPGCTKRHLPGFVQHLAALSALGVDKVIFVATNDAFVMAGWNAQHGHPDIDCVGDQFGYYCDSIGELDPDNSFGLRCNRFALLIRDGVIVHRFQDPFVEGVLEVLKQNIL
jgi:peroxiredoxin